MSSVRSSVFLLFPSRIPMALDPNVANAAQERYLRLAVANKNAAQGPKIMVEYVWIDGSGQALRSKSRTLDFEPRNPGDLPVWNFDGSSTGQAPADDSEVLLKPVALYRSPFRAGKAKMVLCEALKPGQEEEPARGNNRTWCKQIMKK